LLITNNQNENSKKNLLVVMSLLAILIVGGVLYGFYLKPKYEGEVQLKSIQDQTTVYFDDFGVPHIYANNSIDAMTALGYVHAQDRLWQMELMRRIAPGRLSEIFGK
jgi:penicillin amidase